MSVLSSHARTRALLVIAVSVLLVTVMTGESSAWVMHKSNQSAYDCGSVRDIQTRIYAGDYTHYHQQQDRVRSYSYSNRTWRNSYYISGLKRANVYYGYSIILGLDTNHVDRFHYGNSGWTCVM